MLGKKGRPPVIPEAIYQHDFATLAKKEKDARLRVRYLALEQIKTGKGYRETAQMFQVHEITLKNWVEKIATEGVSGLQEKPGRGRKCQLPKDLIESFKEAINELQTKRKGGRINVADITIMAKEKFGLNYTIKGMYYLLHSIKMVWITARSKHPAHNPGVQDAFKKTFLNA